MHIKASAAEIRFEAAPLDAITASITCRRPFMYLSFRFNLVSTMDFSMSLLVDFLSLCFPVYLLVAAVMPGPFFA